MRTILLGMASLPTSALASGFPSTEQIIMALTVFFGLWGLVYWAVNFALKKKRPNWHWALRHLVSASSYPAALYIFEVVA